MKPKKPKPLSWKAKRKGGTYCAPACGRGCTKAEHDLAKKRGNLGWHYRAVSPGKCIEVRENRTPGNATGVVSSYSAFMNEPDRLPGGKWYARGHTPQAAVDAVVRQAKSERNSINEMLSSLFGTEGIVE